LKYHWLAQKDLWLLLHSHIDLSPFQHTERLAREINKLSSYYPKFACINCKNSARVRSLANSPVKAEVVVTEFCFCIPRIAIHKCLHSITTATPSGFNVSCIQSRISLVKRSCTCNLLAKASTTLGILLRPTMWPLGI